MKIALSMSRTEEGASNCISQDWIDWAENNGVTPYLIPNGIKKLEDYIVTLMPNIVVITGTHLDQINKTGDQSQAATERKIIDICVRRKIPLLGVGQGMQFLNKYYGGSVEKIKGHANTSHDVIFTTPWQHIYDDQTSVHSDHGYGIAETGVGPDFTICAIGADGYVEALKHDKHPITGIMWQPEKQLNLKDIDLLKNIAVN